MKNKIDSDKKTIVKRLAIYLVFAYIPLIIAIPILNYVMGGRIYEGELLNSPVTSFVGLAGMLCPTMAHILTRVITKEGFKDTYLRSHFKESKRYYVLAIVLPVVYAIIGALITRAIYGAATDSGMSATSSVAYVVIQIESAVIMAFSGFGEEFGWRAYMMPKLEKLMGTPAAVLVGGIIWGLWHAPLTCSGHNFGTDYAGFPYLGIGLMCVFCICMNSILTYVTKKSKSIYPAAILHTVNNSIVGLIFGLIVAPDVSSIKVFMYMLIPLGAIAVITLVMMMLSNKKEHAQES